MKKTSKMTGGKRLMKMIRGGYIHSPWLWIDTYNQCVNEIAGTIKLRIDQNNCYFVSVLEDECDNGQGDSTDEHIEK